jgi:branched-chain amino acid transport system permease protein
MTGADGLGTAVRDRVDRPPGGDAGLVVAVMLAIYGVVTTFGLLLGLDSNGLVNSLQTITFFTAVYALLALALNLQWGYAGLFNVGVVGFMAVGVYAMTMLTRPVAPASGPPGLGLSLPIGVLGGTAAAAVMGLVAAIPALRVDDDYLAIITIGLAEIVRITIASPALERFSVAGLETGTGGATGIGLPTNPVGRLYYADPASPAAGTTPLGDVAFGLFELLGVDPAIVVKIT